MLRRLVWLLLAANLAYAAWSQGWMAGLLPWLPSPNPTREPQRLAQQVQAERVQVLPAALPTPGVGAVADPPAAAEPASAAPPGGAAAGGATPPAATPADTVADAPVPATAAPAAAPEPTTCVQIAGLSAAQFGVLRVALLSGLPDSGWVVRTSTQPARWLVYSGKLGSAAALAAKKAELRELRVEFREVTTPGLQPGLAMGTFSSEERAQQALKDITRLGVKGARVVPERPETTWTTVQWPKATERLQGQLQTLLQRLADEGLADKRLQPCP